jgi:hypothetical protein
VLHGSSLNDIRAIFPALTTAPVPDAKDTLSTAIAKPLVGNGFTGNVSIEVYENAVTLDKDESTMHLGAGIYDTGELFMSPPTSLEGETEKASSDIPTQFTDSYKTANPTH